MAAPMDKRGILFILVSLIKLAHPQFLDDDFEMASDSVLTVEHSFDTGPNPEFIKRGTVTIQSIKSGVADYSQDRPLDDTERARLQQLAEEGGVYRLRIGSRSIDGSLYYVTGFIKACALYESKLRDTLTMHMDLSGNLIGVSITAAIPYCEGLGVSRDELSNFRTKVDVIQTVPGPVPETQSYIEKVEREKADKVKGQQPDNRSFLGKYWMYIVPVVLIMMFANSADPGAAQGGGGR